MLKMGAGVGVGMGMSVFVIDYWYVGWVLYCTIIIMLLDSFLPRRLFWFLVAGGIIGITL